MDYVFESPRRFMRAVAVSLLLPVVLTPVMPMMAQTPSPSAKEARFVDDLLKKMTLEEKIGQMSQIALNTDDAGKAEDMVKAGQVGSFLFVTDPARINALQHVAVDQSRLHIPILFGFDVIHGFRTVYPVPLAMAASFKPELATLAQRHAAMEASAAGVRWTFAPMVDIAHDARWGRIMEGAGEDPYLGARMAEAQVRGFQGSSLSNADSIVACVKHYAGYGAADGGRDYDSSNISDADLENIYLPPFHAAEKAGAGTFMTAYMDLNGVPAAGNRWLMRDVLKERWGFKGFIVSDWDAVHALQTHGMAKDAADAAAISANAGMDMEMTGHVFRDNLPAQVKSGAVKMATIDEAVKRILSVKYELGLFEHPYADVAAAPGKFVNAEQRAAARKAGAEVAVLLRNEGNLLPLKKAPGTIAVIGPLADSKVDIGGSWSLASHPADNVSVLEGLKQRFAATPDVVKYAKGVEIERTGHSIFDPQFPPVPVTMHTDAEKKAAFDEAIATVKSADVTIMVLGESQNMNGEKASRLSLDLPGKQEELLEAAVATGKPVVLVLMNGRPLSIDWAAQHVPAILEAWYPGTEGGNAVADLLFGDAVPGGKLPATFPRSASQEPLFYAHYLRQNPHETAALYWDGSSAPLYPFGYGLSYAKFSMNNLKMSSAKVAADGTMQVSIDVKNDSNVAGDEVVQLYTHQRAGSASRPVRELKGFKRVSLKAGETQTVTLALDSHELGFWSSATRKFAVEPGTFDLWVGNSSASTENHATFEVTK
ncbi:beta-glucosidase [Granulicella pectinivorans]|uniref:beta-glucosidase n=1 Tax=Granulicella pectinivorans TaxID=474950 RepID=A0A1I6MY92_9BACT|nr:beta-glucosidase BglX [Granulicella pectinivorans]SFS20538.1 beta-glucosidase [Granulicella pectinivorans]